MWLKKYLFVVILGCIYTETGAKSSLTFVIDDTYSMSDDIDQVKENTNLVFDAVLHSNESQIDNFILVTFNDPVSNNKVLTITKDKATFKKALASISVYGGGDCPEYSMSGIEMALNVSHPASYIYVFTDATARDYDKLEKVQNVAVSQQSQVVFLLTGHCLVSKTAPEYAAYYTLSKATDGKVFQMEKSNVGEVLKYISDTIESKKTKLVEKSLPPGHHEVGYKVDDTVKDTTIIVTSDDKSELKVAVYKPNGTEAKTETIMDIPSNKIIKITDPEAGNYSAKVDSKSESILTVTAKTSFNFRHGFSPLLNPSLNATSSRPIAGVNSFIMIQLETPDENIKLKSIDIVDLDDNVIMNYDAKLLDERRKIYFAARFVPSINQFKIAINAKNSRTSEELRRYSKPIEPQKPELVIALPKDPTAEILEGSKVAVSYNETLQLTCKVTGYPKPTVSWELMESGSEIPSVFSVVEPPYNYVSTLDGVIDKNGTYRCRASTNGVEVSTKIEVTLKNTFEVVETPKASYEIPYGYTSRPVNISCKAIAYPPATVTWYFKGEILKGDEAVLVEKDTLKIKHMRPEMEGDYSCDVHNEFHRNVTHFKIRITGYDRPVLSKDISKVTVIEGSDATLTCRLIAGKPKPKITWHHSLADSDGFYTENRDLISTITIPNVKRDQGGTVTCEARNVAGSDQHNILINVEYPPTIKRDARSINAREGTSKTLYCLVNGNPKPHVIWTFNDRIIISDREHHIYRDYSLKIKSSIENSGYYTCQARNKHGMDKKTIEVKYVVPVSIEIPERSTIDTRLGRNLILECHARGYPQPTIEWTFRSIDPEVSPKYLKADSSGSLSLKHLKWNHDGFYTCNASNIDGGTNITYQVNVNGPPEIVDVEKTIYRAVEGDLVVRIPCKATGKPKPVITWSISGFNIAKGTEWYDIEEDGTLVVKNVDIKSRGYHLCKATNHLGSDQKDFLVDVSRFPYDETPSSSVALKDGDRAALNCTLPQDIGSKLRWFKDGRLLSEGELVIDKAIPEDSGLYTCRVSTFAGSKSDSVEVIVTSTPEFQTEPETTLEFDENSPVDLDCTNYAEPAAKTEWYYEGKRLDTDSDTHYFQMLYTNMGEYMCVVSNEIGSINRTFIIKSHDCALHIQNDFTGNLPQMTFPNYHSIKTVGDYIYIPKNLALDLSCPRSFTKIPKIKISATCIKDSEFEVDGDIYKFSDLKCITKRVPEIIRKGFRCDHANTETVDVGFTTEGRFAPVYEVCVDKRNNMPIFTMLSLRRILSGVTLKDPEWFDNANVPFNFEAMYDCDRQNVETSRALNRWFRERDSCCFGKRQLVSPKDVMPGLSQVATYSNLNLVPQWSTCNSENWNNLEDRIRSLAKITDKNLLLWTGQADQLSLRDSSEHNINVTITDGTKHQPVPKYLWKVIQDPSARTSLAIIQVNIPDLTPEKAKYNVLCPDICDRIPWMNDRNWRDVTQGYTYCCGIRDFENAFGYRNKFSGGGDGLLTHIAYISTISLVI